MTTQTLSRVTLQTLDNYRTAAAQTVVATQLGGKRLAGVLRGALQNRVYAPTSKLAQRATERLSEVRGNLTQIVVKGVDEVAQRTGQAIELSSTTAAAQVSKVAEFAAGIDNPLVASGLQTVARLTLPGAKVALALSSKVAQGANALAGAAGARPVHKAVRRAKVAGRSVSTRVGKTAKKVQAPLGKARRAARVAK
jgi:hypothetical protein